MRHLLATLSLILLPLPALAADYPARVVGVTDGDTLTVLRDGHEQVKVRVAQIDAPETGQPFGFQAKRAASDLVFGQQVSIREVGHDRYGRPVAGVILPDGRSLGRELVAAGLAWNYWAFSHEPALADAESAARAAHLGLWSQPHPVPPWSWRRGEGVPATEVVIGNRKSHGFHPPHCRAVAVMKPENRVEFRTAAEAEAKGYHRAGDCR